MQTQESINLLIHSLGEVIPVNKDAVFRQAVSILRELINENLSLKEEVKKLKSVSPEKESKK